MIKVGLTGGIGAGKSTVANYLIELGYPVFNSDLVSRNILMNDPDLRIKLLERWGRDILVDGEISRPKIASIVFNDQDELSFLNSQLHPRVREAFNHFCKESDSDILFKEAAIMFESGAYKSLDKIVNVYCDEKERINRVVKRDPVSIDEVKNRISKQWTDQQREEASDYTIINDGSQEIEPQIARILQMLNNEESTDT